MCKKMNEPNRSSTGDGTGTHTYALEIVNSILERHQTPAIAIKSVDLTA